MDAPLLPAQRHVAGHPCPLGRTWYSEILALLAAHFEEDENYESRVATYLMQLQRDGFIRLLSQSEGQSACL